MSEAVRTGWAKATLDSVCDKITDGTHRSPSMTPDGFLYVTSKNIRPFRLRPIGLSLAPRRFPMEEPVKRAASKNIFSAPQSRPAPLPLHDSARFKAPDPAQFRQTSAIRTSAYTSALMDYPALTPNRLSRSPVQYLLGALRAKGRNV
jgi:hypothetical protein